MCETPQAFKSITRKARKEHQCCECWEVISIGDKYRYSSGIWDSPASYKQCLRCAKISDLILTIDDCLSFSYIKDWFFNQECRNYSLKSIINEYGEKWNVKNELNDLFGNRISEMK